MKVPSGMTVLIGRRKYKAGDELPPDYKEPKNMKDQRTKIEAEAKKEKGKAVKKQDPTQGELN